MLASMRQTWLRIKSLANASMVARSRFLSDTPGSEDRFTASL